MRTGITAVTFGEMSAMREALLAHVQVAQGLDDPKEAVIDVVAAWYRQRFGPAVGSTATNYKTGKVAIRYYDPEMDGYGWLIYDSPEQAKLTGTRISHLPDDGKGWTITERPWRELVYR